MTVPFPSLEAQAVPAERGQTARSLAADDLETLVRALQAAEFDRTSWPRAADVETARTPD